MTPFADLGTIGMGAVPARPHRPQRRCGFTLIELLVVVAIVAVLAAMLMPAVTMVRTGVRQVACVSNMRQVGLSLIQYVGDSEGLWPYGSTWQNDIHDFLNPDGKLATYSSPVTFPVGRCPAAPRANPQNVPVNFTYPYTGVYWDCTYGNASPGPGSVTFGIKGVSLAVGIGRMVRLSEKACLSENWSDITTQAGVCSWGQNALNGWATRAMHKGRSNLAFADGHVQFTAMPGVAGGQSAYWPYDPLWMPCVNAASSNLR